MATFVALYRITDFKSKSTWISNGAGTHSSWGCSWSSMSWRSYGGLSIARLYGNFLTKKYPPPPSENFQWRMFSSKVSFFNARVQAVLLLIFTPPPPHYKARVEAVVLLPCAPPCKHASVVWCSKIEGPPEKIGELMCGSVARKAAHKAE